VTTSVRCRVDEVGPLGRRSLEFDDLEDVVEARTLSEVSATIGHVESAARQGLSAVGFVTYEAAPAFDPALRVAQPGPGRPVLPLVWFALFASSHEVAPVGDPAQRGSEGPRPSWRCEVDSDGHRRAVEHIREAIGRGESYLANLTGPFRAPWPVDADPMALYAQLTAHYSSGLHVYLETDAWAVASGSPELFFDLQGRHLTVKPMKGTARRGRWATEDHAIAESLRTSAKERAENVMVVDLVRNDLGRIAIPGTITVPELCEVGRHPGVWQLSSTVVGELRQEVGLPQVFGALFPCASVTGAPKVSTMRLISEVEHSPRGVYCGAIGYVRGARPGDSSDGGVQARFSVAIRTAVIDMVRGEATYGSGGGITWDSDPRDEWEELCLKAEVLGEEPVETSLAATLLETMRFDPARRTRTDSGIHNLERHLDRLRSSADHLDRRVPEDLRVLLVTSVAESGPARIRLLVDADGVATVELHPLPTPPCDPISLCIDRVMVDPADRGLFHKTIDRRRYDERISRHPGVDDVVLVNLLGEVTETSRANLAVRVAGRWCTPPVASGLLPGVERCRLVESGVLHERSLSVADLRSATEVATISSLRGWLPASVATCEHCSAGS